MNIQVINKINKEACSMTTLRVGEHEYPLTEKEINYIVNLLMMWITNQLQKYKN